MNTQKPQIKTVGYIILNEIGKRKYQAKTDKKGNPTIYKTRTRMLLEKLRENAKRILNDFKKDFATMLRATSLELRVKEAKQALKDGYTFARYVGRLKAYMNLNAFKYSLSKMVRSLLF